MILNKQNHSYLIILERIIKGLLDSYKRQSKGKYITLCDTASGMDRASFICLNFDQAPLFHLIRFFDSAEYI